VSDLARKKKTVDEVTEDRERSLEVQKKHVSHTAKLPSGKQFTFQLPSHLQQLYDKIQAEKLENQKAIEESVKQGQWQNLEDMIESEQHFHVQETVILMYADFMKEIHDSFSPRIEKLTRDLADAVGYVSEKASYYAENISECVSREQMLELKKRFVQELKQELASEEEQIQAIRESEEFKTEPFGKIKKKRK
jgi:wyosine [tRNA(Phe)-imidazoG37] synthetase (radical SAM superfamily)